MAADKFTSNHWSNKDGHPVGGCSYGTGFTVSWQNGPLGRGEDRKEPNGAFVETLINVVIDRIEYYQDSQFKSDYNARAIEHLNQALTALQERTKDREERNVEGTWDK